MSSEIHHNQYIGCATYQIWVLSTSESQFDLYFHENAFLDHPESFRVFFGPLLDKNSKFQVRYQFLVKLICRIQIWCQFRGDLKSLHFRGFWTPFKQNQVRYQFLIKLICRIHIWCRFMEKIKILHFWGFRQNFEKKTKTKWGINFT